LSLQVCAINRLKFSPGVRFWDDRWPVEGRLGLLFGHFQEQQVDQLLDVIAIADPVIPQDAAVVSQALDDGVGAKHQI
jgi:hypothetical protein